MDHRRRTLASEGPLGNALPQPLVSLPSSVARKSTSRVAVPRSSASSAHNHGQAGPHQASQVRLRMANLGSTAISQLSLDGAQAAGGMGIAAGRSSSSVTRPPDQRDNVPSGHKGDAAYIGRTPQTTRTITSRRSSVFASASHGRLSLAQPAYTTSVTRDSRPIRDKNFQAGCMRNIAEYLSAVRCPTQITSKTLVSPTAKEFQSIFRFLVSDLIDPGMTWGKKFEDDVLSILKDLRYPGMDTVSKTAITAPGAPQSWLGLLAMLNWLVELCKAHDNWDDPNCISDPLLMSAHDLPLSHPHLEDRLLWDFASKTYTEWFDGGAEEFPTAEQDLGEFYDRMAATTIEDCEKLDMTIAKRTVELQQLQAQEPPLKKLEDEYLQLMGDKTKFIAFIDLHKQKADKIRQAIGKFRMAIAGQEQELTMCRNELTRIEDAVAAQNLAPDEVNRMNHERESLTRSLEELRTKIADASQLAYDHEMAVTKSMDRFETLLTDYTALGHQIGLLHGTADHAPVMPTDLDYAIDLDLGAEDLDDVRATGARMRASIWQGLQAQRETYRLQAQRLRNEIIALEDGSDRAEQKVERQSGEASNLEARLRVVNEQAEEAQNLLATENANNNKIIAQLESEVTSMMAQSQQSVLSAQSQLESTRIAFKELRHKTALLQDTLVADVGGHIDAVIKAKEHAANSLRGIRTLAESQ